MTSMIDVVFLLIVFFTLVINFTAADQNERVKLPVSELARPPELPPIEPMTLHILAEGNVIYNGIEHSLPQLKESLEKQLVFLKFMKVPTEDVTVIIRGDVHSESGRALDVMELCRELNLLRIVLRARQQEE